MAYERLSDAREKIKWANEHIGDVKVAITKFMGKEPYRIAVETDGDSGQPVVHVLKADAVPPEICLIAGDAIQNMRSALDYLTCALVKVNGKEPSPFTEFPIFNGPIVTAKNKARFDRKVCGVGQKAIDQIKSIHPYKTGDDLLWRLHRLNLIDKHNMLIAGLGNITAANGHALITEHWDGDRRTGISGIPLTLKKGDKFSIPGMKVNKDTQFFAEVVFNQPGIAEGYPIASELKHLHRRVFRVIGELSWALK